MATLVLEEPAASPRAFRPWVVDIAVLYLLAYAIH